MRESRTSGSEGGGVETNRCSLPLSAGDVTGAPPVVTPVLRAASLLMTSVDAYSRQIWLHQSS
jgi:hypothetical protein